MYLILDDLNSEYISDAEELNSNQFSMPLLGIQQQQQPKTLEMKVM